MFIPFKSADPTLDGLIVRLSGWRADALKRLRAVIHEAAPDVVESVVGREGHFACAGPLCFVKIHPTHFNFMFWRGEDLDDPTGLLKSYGKDKIRFLRVATEDDLDPEVLAQLVRSAVAVNQAG